MTTQDSNSALVIQIPNPVHSFHGDHWYHMGEYYLSRMNDVQTWIENWVGQDKGAADKKYTIYLVTSNNLLHRMVTKFTFFFLVLMAWNPIVSKIHLVLPSKGLSTLSPTEYGKITSIAGKISYSFKFSSGKDSYGEPLSLSDQTEHIYRGVLLGVLDNTPRPTSQWFAKETFIRHRLQKHVQNLCPMVQRTSTSHVTDSTRSNSKKRLVIYQRDRIRRIVNIPDIFFPEQLTRIVYSSGTSTQYNDEKESRYLKSNSVHKKEYKAIETMDVDGWEVEIINHDDNREFCEVYHLLNPSGIFNHSQWNDNNRPERESHLLHQETPQQETVLITSHGFQLAALFLLPPETKVIEIFPYKYFKPSYFPLYLTLDLQHRYFQSQYRNQQVISYIGDIPQDTCFADKVCRSFARNQDIYLLPAEINLIRHILYEDILDKYY